MDANEAKLIRISAWSVVGFLVFFGLGWGVLGHNIPPYSEGLSPDAIAKIYREHRDTFRIGFGVGAASTTFYIVWTVGLFRLLKRMERGGSTMSYLQLAGGLLTVPAPLFANIVWLTAALRPERDPEITRALVDLGWMIMDIGFGATILQYIGFGVVVMRDKRTEPLFPKWLAWVGIWMGLEFLVELLMPYFHTGPFSWNGLFNYWIPFFLPFAWMATVVFYTLKATLRLEAEGTTEATLRSASVLA